MSNDTIHECVQHGGPLTGDYCGPECDRLTAAYWAEPKSQETSTERLEWRCHAEVPDAFPAWQCCREDGHGGRHSAVVGQQVTTWTLARTAPCGRDHELSLL